VAEKDAWEIILTRPAQRVYDKASGDIRRRLDGCFADLEKNPIYGNKIKPLTGQLRGLIRYRVGDWRVIFRLFKERKIVEIVAILPRSEAFRS